MTIGNPYDKAHEFARAVRDSQEFQYYAAATKKLQADAAAVQSMAEFRQLQLELEQARVAGHELSEAQAAHMQSSYAQLRDNPLTAQYLEAENHFVRLFSDLQSVVQKDLQLDLDAE